ncbi:DNA repair protein RadC [Rhizobium leguminosarum]|nr:DNA repair protein RadC [Rhizobium leguminosarum]
MTKVIIDATKALDIIVHDQIVIGKDGHVSLKGLKLI